MYHLYLAPAPNCDAAEAQHQCFTFIPVINECLCVSELTWVRQGISAKIAGWRETGVAPRDQTRLTREERVEISTAWRCRPSTSIELQQQHTHTLRHAHTHRQRHTHARTHAHSHTRTDTHTRAHAHIHTRARARTYTHTHTHAHTHRSGVSSRKVILRGFVSGPQEFLGSVCSCFYLIWLVFVLFCHSFC